MAARKPCCVCDAPGGQHCTKCKSRHYCGKACQLVDWKRGHNKACKDLAAAFQDRFLDELMPAKLKIKEEPAIVEDVLSADGSKARLSAVRASATAVVKTSAPNDDKPNWRGTCAICLDQLPIEAERQVFYDCCCKRICTVCHVKCQQHDMRCPLCRAPAHKSEAEYVGRLQKHVDKGNADAQCMLGLVYHRGQMSLKRSFKRAVPLLERAAAQGHALAQCLLGGIYVHGQGVKINHKTADQWYRRAAEQGYPEAQYNLGLKSFHGIGVAQSYGEAVKWYRLAAAQDDPSALTNLGTCHEMGHGVPQDLDEALRLWKRAAALGQPDAAAVVDKLAVWLASTRSGR